MQWRSEAHLSCVRVSEPSWLSHSILPLAGAANLTTSQPHAPSGFWLFVRVGAFAGHCPQVMQKILSPCKHPILGKKNNSGKRSSVPCLSLALNCSLLLHCECAGAHVGLRADLEAVFCLPRLDLCVNLYSCPQCALNHLPALSLSEPKPNQGRSGAQLLCSISAASLPFSSHSTWSNMATACYVLTAS